MRRRKATAKVERVALGFYTIKFTPGGYYHARFRLGKLTQLLTGARRVEASPAMLEKLRERAEQAYTEYKLS